ncbi:flagellar biosynthetic protein FliO [Altererythrobacter sp. CC-YST694]|uniref:flagellar biosynthetic protein FliO n=1 Tax=Altererythrobacter sp. CC-YST694 TaxID=2755038 RepID=UPI001D02AC7B|nr:flagellar biosynthetic protein FliO [Altererythrobacter sp. CC-YST694]MCB5423825.1 flagellar biosynthetic protein FliO [Altererythrobacter sp. CC-YST694]
MMRAAFALTLLALPAPALAGQLAGGSSPDIPWLRMLLALAFCIALAFGAVLLLKRHQRGGGPIAPSALFQRRGQASARRISVIETRRASPTADLCLVECDGETWLLAVTASGATILRGPQ